MTNVCKVVVVFLALALSIMAADPYAARQGSLEVGGFGGVAYLPNGLGAHPVVGVETGVALHPYLTTFGEFSYIPVTSARGNIYGYQVSAHARLFDFGGGIRATIPTGTRVIPYGVFGVGAARLGAGASASGYSYGESITKMAFNGGGGVQIYLNRSVGIRADVRAIKGNDLSTYGRATFGVFYQR